jgi:hypothetical protein
MFPPWELAEVLTSAVAEVTNGSRDRLAVDPHPFALSTSNREVRQTDHLNRVTDAA